MTRVWESVTQGCDEYHCNPEEQSSTLPIRQERKRENVSKGEDENINYAKESPYWPNSNDHENWKQATAKSHDGYKLRYIFNIWFLTFKRHDKGDKYHNSHVDS